jgi:hypothetical protein
MLLSDAAIESLIRDTATLSVMAGLVPATHVLFLLPVSRPLARGSRPLPRTLSDGPEKDVGGRDKPGHDEGEEHHGPFSARPTWQQGDR